MPCADKFCLAALAVKVWAHREGRKKSQAQRSLAAHGAAHGQQGGGHAAFARPLAGGVAREAHKPPRNLWVAAQGAGDALAAGVGRGASYGDAAAALGAGLQA